MTSHISPTNNTLAWSASLYPGLYVAVWNFRWHDVFWHKVHCGRPTHPHSFNEELLYPAMWVCARHLAGISSAGFHVFRLPEWCLGPAVDRFCFAAVDFTAFPKLSDADKTNINAKTVFFILTVFDEFDARRSVVCAVSNLCDIIVYNYII